MAALFLQLMINAYNFKLYKGKYRKWRTLIFSYYVYFLDVSFLSFPFVVIYSQTCPCGHLY